MAIHPLLQGIEVAICVNKAPLPEYDDDESWPGAVTSASGHSIKTITKYIESTADQEFSVMCKFGRPYQTDSPSLNFSFFLDGTRCGGITRDETSYERACYKDGIHKEGQTEGRGYLLPFKFTKIETTLNASSLNTLERDKQIMAKSGQVVVEVYRCGEMNREKRSARGLPNIGIDHGEVHEKALKGHPKYHGAALGEMRPDHLSSTVVHAHRLDGKDSPILRFTFKYRSKKALQELLIIDRDPEPEAVDEHLIPGIDGLNDDQRQKVVSYVRNLKNGSETRDSKIKRERENSGESSRQNKKPKVSEEVECIDLTED